jgi:hypothetical protein
MTVLFFKVENVLNYEGTEAKAPSGRLGVATDKVKVLREELTKLGPGSQLVLYGEWAKDWNFDDSKCTEDGKYLNKKLDRKGLHIMSKTDGSVEDYLSSHHVDNYFIL